MRTFKLLLVAAVAFVATQAHANGPWIRSFQDMTFPSQEILEHDVIVNPILAITTRLVNAGTAATSAATTFSTIALQPDVPRNITITPGGTTANVGAGTAVVTGTNIFGRAITENISISSTQSTTSTGNKAFKTVSSVLFPATTGASVTVSIGVGSKLGIRRCVDNAGAYGWSVFNGAFETTRGTLAASATAVESNTFTPNGTMDGAKNVELLYFQNFRCYP